MKRLDTLRLGELCFRWALGATFLSAVADRFGLWGPPGSPNAGWGNWAEFLGYSASLNWYLPDALQNPVAIIATVAEIAFAVGLITGMYLRYAAYGSAVLLTLFALAMAVTEGVKSPLAYAVFPAAAGALFLAAVVSNQPFEIQEREK